MRQLTSRQKKLLDKQPLSITSYVDLPSEVWDELERINNTEILWQEVNRYLMDRSHKANMNKMPWECKVTDLLEKLKKAIKEEDNEQDDYPATLTKAFDSTGYQGMYKKVDANSVEFENEEDAKAAHAKIVDKMKEFPIAKELQLNGKRITFKPVTEKKQDGPVTIYDEMIPGCEDSFWYDGQIAGTDHYTLYAVGDIRVQFKGEDMYYKDAQAFDKARELGAHTDKELYELVTDWGNNNWFVIEDNEEHEEIGIYDTYSESIETLKTLEKEYDEQEEIMNMDTRESKTNEDANKDKGEKPMTLDQATKKSGYDKLPYSQTIVGKSVKLKGMTAWGSTGTVVSYNDMNDRALVRVGTDKIVSVSKADMELVESKKRVSEVQIPIRQLLKDIIDYYTGTKEYDSMSNKEFAKFIQDEIIKDHNVTIPMPIIVDYLETEVVR